MKKLVLLIALALTFNITFADDLNSSQLALRSEIMQFLSEEGFMPSIDGDGDIQFKKEGTTYYVQINSKNTSPMYLTLSRYISYPESYSKEILILASAEINLYKAVKIIFFEDSYSIRAEMFLVNADTFKYSFYKLMDILQSAAGSVMDECANAKATYSGIGSGNSSSNNAPFTVSEVAVGISDNDGNMVTQYGNTLYDFNTKYLKPKVTVNSYKSGTYTVYVRLYKNNSLSTSSSSPEGYTYSKSITLNGSGKQTFEFKGWGGNTPGHWEAGSYRFEFWYNGICIGSKDFKIY